MPTTQTFSPLSRTGTQYIVPAGVTQLTVELVARGRETGFSGEFWSCARVQGTLKVAPGEVLWLYATAGGDGGLAGTTNNQGNGDRGQDGVDIRRTGGTLLDRVAVAGGHGGFASGGFGSNSVGKAGHPKGDDAPASSNSTGGRGGTQTAGGAGGSGANLGPDTQAGNGGLGTGGAGGNGQLDGYGGGGGGGGYYGAGGGGGGSHESVYAAGGGGGSSYGGGLVSPVYDYISTSPGAPLSASQYIKLTYVRTYTQTVNGAFNLAGSIKRFINFQGKLRGVLDLAGTVLRAQTLRRTVSGALLSSGRVIKQASRRVIGTSSFVGLVGRAITKYRTARGEVGRATAWDYTEAAEKFAIKPRFWFEFSEPSLAATAQDSTPNDNDGDYMLTPARVASPFGGFARRFNGTVGQHVAVTPAPVVSAEWTLEAWLNISNLGGSQILGEQTSPRLELVNVGGQPVVRLTTETTVDSDPINLASWHHVAAVRRVNGVTELWINGVLQRTGSSAVSLDGDILVGGAPLTAALSADIALPTAYPHALEPTEILDHYLRGNNSANNVRRLEGRVVRGAFTTVRGVVSFSSTVSLLKQLNQFVSGQLNMTGSLGKAASRTLRRTLTSVGNLYRVIPFLLRGGIDFHSLIEFIYGHNVFVAGFISPVGGVSKYVSRTLASVLSPIGSLFKYSTKSFTGAVAPGGAMLKATLRMLVADLTPLGRLTRQAQLIHSGEIDPVGSPVKKTAKLLKEATLGVTGAVIKGVAVAHVGTLLLTGRLHKLVDLGSAFYGVIGPQSRLIKDVRLTAFTGAITPVGRFAVNYFLTLVGAVDFAGNLVSVSRFRVRAAYQAMVGNRYVLRQERRPHRYNRRGRR